MSKEELIENLSQKIKDELSPLIDSDYVLLDLPYYHNIGDLLIWAGEEAFLSQLPYNCLLRSSISFSDLEKIDEKTVILLQGGGNFGDLYRHHQEFRLSIIQKFPRNRIIILPQTIYFANWDTFRKEIDLYSKHNNLYMCVRDKFSYNIAKFFGLKNVILLPDMAFCLGTLKESSHPKFSKLLVKRVDKEGLKLPQKIADIKFDMVSDWPTYSSENKTANSFYELLRNSQNKAEVDEYAYNILCPRLIETGIDFISDFQKVYSTRLHACILSILLSRDVVVLNNSYGKNMNFYNTWLRGVEGIECESSLYYKYTNVKSFIKSFLYLQLAKIKKK